jgi:membrane protease YdiL (CAAX protease family)
VVVLPEQRWEAEPLLRLVAGICFCMSFIALAASAMLPADAASTAEGRFFLLVTNAVALHGVTLLLISMFLRAHGIGWGEGFGLRAEGAGRAIGFAVLGFLVALPVALGLQHLSALGMEGLHQQLVSHDIQTVDLQPQPQQLVQTLQQTESSQQRIFFGLVAILFAPVVEEIIFRGVLYPAIKQRGRPHLALWGTSLLFALIHANMATFIPLAFLALILVFLYERTGNLLAPILTHSLFNTANYLALIYERELKELVKAQ